MAIFAVGGSFYAVSLNCMNILSWVTRTLPRGLRCGSPAVSLLGLRVRMPPGAWISLSCECCALSSRGLCNGPITCPEESYRVSE
jgi:hypothetical protein